MDFKALGLMAGIEIHQQLDTKEKLFCHCPTTLRETEEHTGEFVRYLHATVSEMGEVDRAAAEEMMNRRQFRYFAYDTTCLVENDEEPPAPMNQEALEIALQVAKTFEMHPVEQVHTMRKLVIDGSNTSGFQRTAMVALAGVLPGDGEVETICLEEEAAQRVVDGTFSLDRLGIPLVEITTSPCMHTPEAVQETARHIGMVLRSTGRVKRGLGTIRQDVNVSIKDGARVEIKGVQELDLIAEVVRREVTRQVNLLAIRDELRARNASVGEETHDVTALFAETNSSILKRAKSILAVVLPGFAGLVGREVQPGRRLGTEISDYVKKCGLGGIFHTDELPAYGVTAEEVAMLRAHLGAADGDAVILISGSVEKAACGAKQVRHRARLALEGVPEETRKMLDEGNTAYMRPLPGAARMYPETDVLPVTITDERWSAVEVPELLSDLARRMEEELGLDPAVARQAAYSEHLPLFRAAVQAGIRPNLAARTVLGTLKELSRAGVAVEAVADQDVLTVLAAVEAGEVAKEAVPDLLTEVAGGTPAAEAVEEHAGGVSAEDLAAIVAKIVADRIEFVQDKQMRALGPLMGVVMEEVRGKVDGKKVSEALRAEISRVI
ncbi:Glu-tRNA(Gln) amidotransferase subunit GatE [Methanofollis formosanus]|uniref:Glutamyl-tRNA(Gln) amidotransferase subunit E n=1 Tax=Methanofollis formosanus TaxID=299308 RepID=A0A8G1A451_9EURY|nr:Glu-tRNA(Gln) amidotransferase subunit GatE [Methanofollis formosanus]QYZ80111.1 Glu-tRNA(Gln) amidotransferase subunit GatE [Methanofollis formosanus]